MLGRLRRIKSYAVHDVNLFLPRLATIRLAVGVRKHSVALRVRNIEGAAATMLVE